MLAIQALTIGAASIALAYWWNRSVRGFLPDDLPRPGRKQHARPVPLAGIALVPPILFWTIGAGQWLLAAAVAAGAIVGFVDDWYKELDRDLDWRIKLVVLGLAAAAVAGQVVDPFAEPERWCLAWLLVFVLTNATNFLDNTDGVATSLLGTGLVLAAGGAGPLAAVGLTALAFVPWNWPRPILFLGDSGAYAVGLCAGAACAATPPSLAAVLPFAIPLLDFTQVVAARLFLGLPPWVGDRRHLTHIAQNLGMPRVFVAPTFALLGAGIAAVGLWS